MGAVKTAGRGREVEASPEVDWTVTVGLEAMAWVLMVLKLDNHTTVQIGRAHV